jgi:hypothetical protein
MIKGAWLSAVQATPAATSTVIWLGPPLTLKLYVVGLMVKPRTVGRFIPHEISCPPVTLGARGVARAAQVRAENALFGDFYCPDKTFLIVSEDQLLNLAFISNACLPEESVLVGKWEIAPDLAIEVISSTELYRKVQTKLRDYFAAGAREV